LGSERLIAGFEGAKGLLRHWEFKGSELTWKGKKGNFWGNAKNENRLLQDSNASEAWKSIRKEVDNFTRTEIPNG